MFSPPVHGLVLKHLLFFLKMADCQNYGPLVGPYNNTGPNTGPNLGDPKRDPDFDNLPNNHSLLAPGPIHQGRP